MDKSKKAIVNFLFEVGILSKTPRSGFYFLGSGNQSVAEHINRVVYVGLCLGDARGRC
jgi:putative hydrolases of HD superfamily